MLARSGLAKSPLLGLQTAAFVLCLTCTAEVTSSSSKIMDSSHHGGSALIISYKFNYLSRVLPPNNLRLGRRAPPYAREGRETQSVSLQLEVYTYSAFLLDNFTLFQNSCSKLSSNKPTSELPLSCLLIRFNYNPNCFFLCGMVSCNMYAFP